MSREQIRHMDVCADSCETFGNSIKLSAVPTTDNMPPLFYIKNYNFGKKDEEDSWGEDGQRETCP